MTTKLVSNCLLLQFIFLVFKLTGVISWSWLWVLAPLWSPPILLIASVGIVTLLFAALCGVGFLCVMALVTVEWYDEQRLRREN